MAYKKSTDPEFYKITVPLPTQPKTVKIIKFDCDLDATSIYNMNWIETKDGGYHDCQCPASKFDCRHKGILKTIEDAGMISSEKFYCHQAPTNKPELQGKFVDATEI